jgi:hypothetical protein
MFRFVILLGLFVCSSAMAETYRQVGAVEDFSYLGVKRIGIRVYLPGYGGGPRSLRVRINRRTRGIWQNANT